MVNQISVYEDVKVLVLDPDTDFIHGLAVILREDRCRIYSAGNAKKGLEMISTIRPEIILLGVSLPDINGIELCKTIKSDPANADIAVILVPDTTSASYSSVGSFESNADGYLPKTLTFREMNARLKIYIQSKLFEKDINKSEGRFRIAQDLSPDGFTILHPVRNENGDIVDFTWVYQNQTAARINGTDPDGVVGKRLLDLFPTHSGTTIFTSFIRTANTGNTQIIEEVNAGGTISQPVWLRLVIVSLGEDIGIFAVNITGRKQAELALSESEERFRKIISAVPDLIVLTDLTGKINYINDIPFPSLSHLSNEAILGQHMFSFIAEEDLPRAIDNTRLMFEGKLGPKEYKLKTQDGTVIHSEVNGDVLYDAENRPTGMVYVIRDITNRKQVEAALDISEDRFKSIIAISNTGAWEFHRDSNYLWCSPEYFYMLGRDPADFVLDGSANLNETWIDLLHPDDRERASRHFADYLDGGSVGMYENTFRLKHRNGNWVWIWSKGQTLLNNDGELTNRTLGTHIDITESKKSEEELIQAKERVELNERKLKGALEIGKMGSWELDVTTGIFTFTDNFYNIFHTNAQEMGGYRMTVEDYARQFVHPEDASKVTEETKIAMESNDPGFSKTLEHRILYYDGGIGYISVRFFVVKDEHGNTIKTYGVNQDITEKKLVEFELVKAKEKAEESQKKFKAIADTSPLAIYISKGIRQVVEYINPTFYRLFGYTYQEVSEVALWWPLAYPDPEYQKKVSEEWNRRAQIAIENCSDIEPMEVVVKCKDGTEKNILWGFVSTGDENWAFGMDLTAYRITEKELIAAKEKAEESDRLKSAFLANMSHEIRTPMNGILGFAELLKEPGLTGNQQLQFIEIINKSGQRMLNIINDIVDISKIESGLMELHLSETNIQDQMEYIYNFFLPQAKIKGLHFSVKSSLSGNSAAITTDREKVYSILTNLIKNAIKYTPVGDIELGCAHKGNFLEFYVKDTGIGIPEDRQQAIFERFIQADIEDKMARQGAGLGLSITKAYIEMLGGRIWLESKEGIGSTFFFSLPFDAKAEASCEAGINTADDIPDAEKLQLVILVAEDDETSEMLLERNLRPFAKKILKARSGVEAVELARKNPDIDLILMDIRLPELDGYEATRQIRKFNPATTIIAQTAYGLTGDREKALGSGCNDYLSKPLSRDELKKLILRYHGKNLSASPVPHKPKPGDAIA